MSDPGTRRPRPRSLNNGQTRPLTDAGRAALYRLRDQPVPRSALNPGVVDRLLRDPEPLAELVTLPSPFSTHRGAAIPHLQITAAGRAVLTGDLP